MDYKAIALGLASVILLYLSAKVVKVSAKLFRSYRKRKLNDENRLSQEELDHYLSTSHSIEEIGRMYERQIGFLYESDNYYVEFNGLENGVLDQGLDLIMIKGKEVLLVQAKCWSKKKLIPLNQIYQIIGATKDYEIDRVPKGLKAKPVFISACQFSSDARTAANRLGVELINLPLDKSYPMIKCNNSSKGDKIYHLPIDPFYDKIKINLKAGDFYARTVSEAAARGFRRAKKYKQTG